MAGAIIETRGLTVLYRDVVALDRLDLRIEEGTVGLLGPNGAGKSTLIKVLLGLVRPAAGEATLLGSPVSGRESLGARARIGYMPEEDCLVPRLDGVEFLRLCARLCGVPDAEGMKRAHEVLFLVGLGEARYRKVESYSTGMRQRLKLAQALVHGPDLLFLDEPTSALDPAGRREMLDLIHDVASREGLSVVLSTHLLGDVEEVCERVTVLDGGRLVMEGRIEDLRRVLPDRFHVRVKGDEAAFLKAAEAQGATRIAEDGAVLTFDLPGGTGPGRLMDAATASGTQVRLLQPVTLSLREAFARSLEHVADRGPQS